MGIGNKLGWTAGGVLLGTLGYRILKSPEMKKLYTYCTSSVLREKDTIMKGITDIREDCSDIYADAKARNKKLAEEKDQIIADRAAEQDAE